MDSQRLKSFWKSRAASNSSCISHEMDLCLGRATKSLQTKTSKLDRRLGRIVINQSKVWPRFSSLTLSTPNVCQYLTFYRLLVLYRCVQCCLLQSVHWLSLPHNVPSGSSVSLRPLLSSTFCPLSVSTLYFTVCWFCVTMPTVLYYSLSTLWLL